MMMEGSPPTQIPPSSFLYRLDKLAYSTPPPVSNDPANNTYRIIDYRGAKIASFHINGEVMICLPQAFELFLKHLVGGLHTVYTKLKRLNITPIVCNVEQVRVLRSIGAIQPGVNRCKLLTRKQFDVLYDDCTTASSRPGRPPKRSMPLSLTHSIPGLPSHHPLEALKRHKLENGLTFGYDGIHASPYLLAHHPAFMHSSLAMAAPHLPNLVRNSDLAEGSGSDGEQHSISPPVSMELHHRRVNGKCSPIGSEHSLNGSSKSNGITSDEEGHGKDNMEGDDFSDGSVASHNPYSPTLTTVHSGYQTNTHHRHTSSLHQSISSDLLISQGPSSMETLLTNIQGLLKVAADNARQQEKQNNLERAELKLEMLREKELRESMQKQLAAEQRRTAILLKRLKKEKRAKRKLLEQNGVISTEGSKPIENGDAIDLIKKYKVDSVRVNTETCHNEKESPIHTNQSDGEERSHVVSSIKSERSPVASAINFNGQH